MCQSAPGSVFAELHLLVLLQYICIENYTRLFLFSELLHGIETDKVNPYIEDCIAREESLIKVLRLICIQSVCNDGLKPKVLEHYKREIIQVCYCTNLHFVTDTHIMQSEPFYCSLDVCFALS